MAVQVRQNTLALSVLDVPGHLQRHDRWESMLGERPGGRFPQLDARQTRVTLQDLGSIGELVAAIATIGTLVYLALQIRQNTEGLRVNSYNQSTNELGRLLEAVYLNPEFTDIFRRGSIDPAKLSEEERPRFTAYLAAFYYNYENLFALFERGKVEPEMWENALRNALPLFARPGIKEIGARRTGAVSRRFAAYLRDQERAA